VVLGKYESEQAVHTPARVQVVQLVIRVGQSTQDFPSVLLGKYEPEQAVHTPEPEQLVQLGMLVEQ